MNTLAKKNKLNKLAPPSPRALALKVLFAVVLQGRSLTDALSVHLRIARPENAFAKQLCFGTLRFYQRLQWQLQQLLTKPLKEDQQSIALVILLGLYQLQFSHVPTHAAVSETVELLREINQEWAIALVNAVLRNFLRQQTALDQRLQTVEIARYSHPAWLIKTIKTAWPQVWPAILDAGLTQAPLTVRVNIQQITRQAYLDSLSVLGLDAVATVYSPVGVRFAKGLPAAQIPGFSEGHVSVQDEAAQLAALLLAPRPGERILDACAAPGGKSCHLLESAAIHLTALEVDATRCQLIQQNCDRLHLTAAIIHADAAELDQWWDKKCFDRILLDAPCSATGIIRRQPDIKLHRQPADIKRLALTQTTLLTRLWSTLKPGGRMVYATCSILPSENQAIISAFVSAHADAILIASVIAGLTNEAQGLVILPGIDGMDGFFYATLEKRM